MYFCELHVDGLFYCIHLLQAVINSSPSAYPDGYFWRGCMRNGRTGLFRPDETVAKLAVELPNSKYEQSLPLLSVPKHSKFSSHEKDGQEKALKKLLISEPQGDVRHTCHIGADGTAFGLLQVFNQVSGEVSVSSPLITVAFVRFSLAHGWILEVSCSEIYFT